MSIVVPVKKYFRIDSKDRIISGLTSRLNHLALVLRIYFYNHLRILISVLVSKTDSRLTIAFIKPVFTK